ncbi:MAG: c-type cytochrome [Nitrospiraceae bacterium]
MKRVSGRGGVAGALLNSLLALLVLFAASGCSKDMQEQASYQPQESPRLHSPAGSVPLESRSISGPPRSKAESRLKRGARLFAINCAHCHGPHGEGDGPVAGYLVELPKNLRAPHVQKKTEPELYEILTHGRDAMPSFEGELSATERWTLAHFVKQFKAEVEAEIGTLKPDMK